MPGHTPFLTTLRIGEIRNKKGSETTYIASSGGFAEVVDDKVTLLVDTAESAKEIDVSGQRKQWNVLRTMLKTMAYDHTEYRLMEWHCFGLSPL